MRPGDSSRKKDDNRKFIDRHSQAQGGAQGIPRTGVDRWHGRSGS